MRPRARTLPAPARLAPFHLPGPGKRRARGSRPSGPPDMPGIAAHNCTFPGQRTSPAGPRGPAWPAALTCGWARGARLSLRTSRLSRGVRPRLPGARPSPPQALRPLRPPGPSWRQVRVVAWARAAHFPAAWTNPALPCFLVGEVEGICPSSPVSLQRVREEENPDFLPPLAGSALFRPFDRPSP